jgi:hypothetical protein
MNPEGVTLGSSSPLLGGLIEIVLKCVRYSCRLSIYEAEDRSIGVPSKPGLHSMAQSEKKKKWNEQSIRVLT